MMLRQKTAKEEFYGTKKPRKICDVDFQEEPLWYKKPRKMYDVDFDNTVISKLFEKIIVSSRHFI